MAKKKAGKGKDEISDTQMFIGIVIIGLVISVVLRIVSGSFGAFAPIIIGVLFLVLASQEDDEGQLGHAALGAGLTIGGIVQVILAFNVPGFGW